MAFHQLFFGGVFGWHPHLQQELGRTLVEGFVHSTATQAIFKFGKMLLRREHGPVPRLHC